jgi:AAHS family 4-hydroxybenzoate transporter-like MFS transporter
VFAAGLFGILVGSLIFSVLADKLGRRPVLVGATLYYALLTMLTAFAQTIEQLVVIRFVAGLGLGAIMPNAVALVSEYSPRRWRATLMMVVANGFTIGAAVGGFVSAWLIPGFGWRSVFVFGGAVPLLVALAMWRWLPESLPLLVSQGRSHPRMREWLHRVDPLAATSVSTALVAREQPKGGFLVAQLFSGGRAVGTILLWIVYFMNLVNLYALSAWLPTVVRDSGYTAETPGRRSARDIHVGMADRSPRLHSSAGYDARRRLRGYCHDRSARHHVDAARAHRLHGGLVCDRGAVGG